MCIRDSKRTPYLRNKSRSFCEAQCYKYRNHTGNDKNNEACRSEIPTAQCRDNIDIRAYGTADDEICSVEEVQLLRASAAFHCIHPLSGRLFSFSFFD